MTNFVLSKFNGGVSSNNPRDLKDNQLAACENMGYSSDAILSTMPGYAKFGSSAGSTPFTSLYAYKFTDGSRVLLGFQGGICKRYNETTGVWDTLSNASYFTEFEGRKLIHSCDSFSSNGTWVGTDDARSVVTDTSVKIQGDGSVRFNLDTAFSGANQAVLTNSTLTAVNLAAYEDTGKIRMYFNIPEDAVTFELRWGTDSSNYWTKTASATVYGGGFSSATGFWNFAEFDWATATQVGTPDASNIAYLQVLFLYSGTYSGAAGVTNAGIDFIAIYPSGNQISDKRTMWDFAPYKGRIWMTNGVDPYISYSLATGGIVFSGGSPGRYVEYVQDRLVAGGDDLFPNRLMYTNANPTSGSITQYTNALDVGADDTFQINVIREVGRTVTIGKDEKIYDVNFATPSALPIDATGGMFGSRSAVPVGNALIYQSKRGIETLQTNRLATTGSVVDTNILSEDIQAILQEVSPTGRKYSVGEYIKATGRCYYSFDTDGDGKPDKTVVLSTIEGTKGFTIRTLPPIYDYVRWEDANGNDVYLFAPATTGQIYQFETGILDDDTPIQTEVATKVLDFGSPEQVASYEYVYIFGKKNRGGEIKVEVLIDGEVAQEATINDDFAEDNTAYDATGSVPVGTEPIGGYSEDFDSTYKIKIPLFTFGQTIQIKMVSSQVPTLYTLERITVSRQGQELSYFPFDNIA